LERENNKIEHLEYFKEQFLKYYVSLCVFALRYVKDADVSKDIVQDCFLSLWEKRGSIDYSTSIKPLLFKSVHDKAVDVIRQSSVNNIHLNQEAGTHPLDELWDKAIIENTDEKIDCVSIQKEIDTVVSKLPNRCMLIYKMSREQGMSNNDIAEKLHINVKSVEKQITKALSSIRTHLVHTGYMPFVLFALIFFPDKLAHSGFFI
jgi:RNA polymerase sigma-70 factor (family 1)